VHIAISNKKEKKETLFNHNERKITKFIYLFKKNKIYLLFSFDKQNSSI